MDLDKEPNIKEKKEMKFPMRIPSEVKKGISKSSRTQSELPIENPKQQVQTILENIEMQSKLSIKSSHRSFLSLKSLNNIEILNEEHC